MTLRTSFLSVLSVFILFWFGQNSAWSQVDSLQTLAPTDSIADASAAVDSAVVDSARIERAATQARLSKEVSALSQSALGTNQYTWTHRGQLAIARAGQEQRLSFWTNIKDASTPKLWSSQTGNDRDVFFLDPATGRAASLNLDRNTGSFIPARLAEKAGFTGNGSSILPKKSEEWLVQQRTDSTATYVREIESDNITVVLSQEKDTGRASAMVDWLRLQPMQGIALPYEASKFPVLSLTVTGVNGQVSHQISCEEWGALEEPLKIDGNQLTISDPERDLQTIAREWAEQQKKAAQGQ